MKIYDSAYVSTLLIMLYNDIGIDNRNEHIGGQLEQLWIVKRDTEREEVAEQDGAGASLLLLGDEGGWFIGVVQRGDG